jgi:hypothetical protein
MRTPPNNKKRGPNDKNVEMMGGQLATEHLGCAIDRAEKNIGLPGSLAR